jgi:uncharacterized protein YheU (UPF0270 family)
MATFNSIEEFIAQAKNEIEASVKSVLPELKERAEDIVIEKIYGAYEPKVYYRIGQLLQAFDIKCERNGDECIGTLFVKNITHAPNPTWNGEDYTLDEIINEYFVRGGWGNGSRRQGVNVMELTNQEMIETGQALQLLLNELKKYFDII